MDARDAMLMIRRDQVTALGAPLLETIVASLVDFLRELDPAFVARAGERDVRSFVIEGVRRAGAHGIVRCCDVGRYLAFMLTLGAGFDADPRHAWARRILRDDRLAAAEKLEHLLDAAKVL